MLGRWITLVWLMLMMGLSAGSANAETIGEGLTDSISTLQTPESKIPTAIISAFPTVINESESVSFSAKESHDPDGKIISYTWDFGDGNAGKGTEVEHAFSRKGVYITTLKVTDDSGLYDSDMVEIVVNRGVRSTPIQTNRPPMAHIKIDPNPAVEGDIVNISGFGEDHDGEVVEYRMIFPDGSVRSESGDSYYFEEEDAEPGLYCFSVRDNKGRWSEEACLELNIDPALPPVIPWFWISIAVLAAAIPTLTYSIKRIRFGSMRISSNPDGAMVFLDKIQMGRSPIKINKVPIGPHIVEFVKFGYFVGKKEGVVILNKTSIVHIELSAIPDMKLKLSADSTEIPADGRSISTITICLQGKKEDKGSIPIIVPIDTEVTITTDLGSIVSPVKINAGSSLTTATLTSSTSIGITTVTARVKNVDRIDLEDSITINFLDPTIVA